MSEFQGSEAQVVRRAGQVLDMGWELRFYPKEPREGWEGSQK